MTAGTKNRFWLLCLFGMIASLDLAGQKSVSIAMGQIFALDGDRAGNLHRIEMAIKEAAGNGAQIIVFPESCILGWVNAAAHQRAYAIPGADTDQLCLWARQYRIFICIGLDEKAGDQLFDAVVLIDDDGRLILKHRKINVLPELMTPPYSVGQEVTTVTTKFGRIGMLICADSFQEDVVDKMALQKPDLLLIPYGWAADEHEWPQHAKEMEIVVQKAALKVKCPVVGTDVVGQISDGPWKGKVYGGQSVAVDQTGKVLARGKDRDREVVIVTIPLNHK